jgi:hypothetical protein
MPEAHRRDCEETERLHQGDHAAIRKAQAGGALVRDDDGLTHGVEVVFTDQAIVAQSFDV